MGVRCVKFIKFDTQVVVAKLIGNVFPNDDQRNVFKTLKSKFSKEFSFLLVFNTF